MFDHINDKLDGHTTVHTDILNRIDEGFKQVNARQDVANGRTGKNELWINRAIGGLVVVSMVILPLLSWALYTLTNVNDEVLNAVRSELDSYQIEIVE